MTDLQRVLAYAADLVFIGIFFLLYIFGWYILPFFIGWSLVKFLMTGHWL